MDFQVFEVGPGALVSGQKNKTKEMMILLLSYLMSIGTDVAEAGQASASSINDNTTDNIKKQGDVLLDQGRFEIGSGITGGICSFGSTFQGFSAKTTIEDTSTKIENMTALSNELAKPQAMEMRMLGQSNAEDMAQHQATQHLSPELFGKVPTINGKPLQHNQYLADDAHPAVQDKPVTFEQIRKGLAQELWPNPEVREQTFKQIDTMVKGQERLQQNAISQRQSAQNMWQSFQSMFQSSLQGIGNMLAAADTKARAQYEANVTLLQSLIQMLSQSQGEVSGSKANTLQVLQSVFQLMEQSVYSGNSVRG